MRFKAALKRPDRLRDVCVALAPVRRECLLKLSESQIQLVAIPGTGGRGMQVWASLGTGEVFDNFTLGSKDNNEINLEINVEHLLRGLRSCVMPGSDHVLLRLSKRNKIPFLMLSIDRDSGVVGSSRRITQELPVRILNRAACAAIVEPHVAPPHVAICLPDGSGGGRHQLLRISDRFKQLASHVLVKANNQGKFSLSLIDQDSFHVDTEWVGLTNPELEHHHHDDSQQQHMQSLDNDDWTRSQLATVRIETRDWSNLLRVLSLRDNINNNNSNLSSFATRMPSSTTTTIACIRDETTLVVYCFLSGVNNEQGGLLTYYLSNEKL